jgi:hypothetical protein
LDRVHELELTSLRHELELRVAYNASLEQKIDEYSQEITWLRGEVEFLRLRLTESTSARSTRLSRRAVRASVALIRRSRLLTSLLRRLRSLVRESM